ncbi:hypothetical protein KR074_000457 [Drosophila pseudoananassae]|nr:hypothetical protein KR074_000457 [Drosophila pseudoananassae]
MDETFHQTMESLDLPKEYWDLKLEPQSPNSTVVSDLFALTEAQDSVWLYDDNFANGINLIGDEESMTLNDAASLEMLSDEELVVEIFDLKDECLLDQKTPLNYINYEANSYQPNIDVVSQPIIPETKVQFPAGTASAVPVEPTVDFHCDAPSLILQQLTPPQSPPQFDAIKQQAEPHSVLVKAEEKVQYYASDSATPAAASTPATFNFNAWVGGSEIARENQIIDDIVNMRAQELELPTNWEQDDCESQSSSSLGGSSASRVSGSIADADEEWIPESISSSSSPAHTSVEELAVSPKKRTRTYGRGVEDRKIRKKEQNKNAATRYRQKKKMEMENVMGEEQELTQENEELRRRLGERRNEMRYLRQLIREFYQERKR